MAKNEKMKKSNKIMIWKPTGPSYESEGIKLKKI